MVDEDSSSGVGSEDLLLDIVETLEDCGLGRDQYQLYEYVDVDALAGLVSNTGGDVDVRVTVEGVSLSVSRDGVKALDVR